MYSNTAVRKLVVTVLLKSLQLKKSYLIIARNRHGQGLIRNTYIATHSNCFKFYGSVGYQLLDLRMQNQTLIEQIRSIFKQTCPFVQNFSERKNLANREKLQLWITLLINIKEMGFKFGCFIGLPLITWKKKWQQTKVIVMSRKHLINYKSMLPMSYKRNCLRSWLFCWFLSPLYDGHESTNAYVSLSRVCKRNKNTFVNNCCTWNYVLYKYKNYSKVGF